MAVVKAGAFTIMRVTYYSFGTDIFKRELGAVCGNGACDFHDCVRLQPRPERDAYQTAACLVYGQQSIVYPVWRSADDSAWPGGGAKAIWYFMQ